MRCQARFGPAQPAAILGGVRYTNLVKTCCEGELDDTTGQFASSVLVLQNGVMVCFMAGLWVSALHTLRGFPQTRSLLELSGTP